MRSRRFLLILALAAALIPFAPRADVAGADLAFPGWPREFEGSPLTPVALTEEEKRFAAAFPGAMARFTDGNRHILIRWVAEPSRRVHPGAECFRAWGYEVAPLSPVTDGAGDAWGAWSMTKDGTKWRLRERVVDRDGRSWTEIGAWYWDAVLGRTPKGWFVYSVTEGLGRNPSDSYVP